ncbi:FAD-dependent monooxygenase [Gluconacetobacter tumulisoli]|uniref:Pentachlorophenol monooxygenase n=1 Tax=Gluconacetobacter tumulisoli TaxID=1286189 RepID=A0A7W4K6F9_9PROT|nr:FAD-dependent monooxygenase [Gluconacetobacter tumulisoli]MBB2201090.1 pentachlorophenol monooxygenase [Gluconacetobacter tumulisoli]
MDIPDHIDVLIVGAGPVGLALAAALCRSGVSACLLDRQAEGANTSRAAVVHARSLEMLEDIGATPLLLREGLKIPLFRVREHDRVLMEIDLGVTKTTYPFALTCPQNRTEAILLSRLVECGGTALRPVDVTAIRPVADGIEVDASMDGGVRTVRAQWVVGCDGVHSLVRQQAGIGFVGGAYAEEFALADVHMSWPLDREEVSLFLSPDGLVVVVPLPGDRFRIVATVADAPDVPDVAYMQALLSARGPTGETMRVTDVVWGSRFHIQHRVATVMRKGRVLLCGDAAHVHSPAGGQGMNTGLQDAISLAASLARAVHDGDEGDLDTWAARRLRIAREVVTMTDRMTRVATARSMPMRLLRNLVIGVVGRLPGMPERIAGKLAELDRR